MIPYMICTILSTVAAVAAFVAWYFAHRNCVAAIRAYIGLRDASARLDGMREALDQLSARVRRLHGRIYSPPRVGPDSEPPPTDGPAPIETEQTVDGSFEALLALQSATAIRP